MFRAQPDPDVDRGVVVGAARNLTVSTEAAEADEVAVEHQGEVAARGIHHLLDAFWRSVIQGVLALVAPRAQDLRLFPTCHRARSGSPRASRRWKTGLSTTKLS